MPAGLVWVLWFQSVMRGIEQREPEVARALLEPAQDSSTASNSQVWDWRFEPAVTGIMVRCCAAPSSLCHGRATVCYDVCR